jgi:hypothetical protein
VAVHLEDETDNTTATLFNNAVENITGITCRDLVVKHNNTDHLKTPKQIREIVGQVRTFELEVQKDQRYTSTYFTCNRTRNPTEKPTEESQPANLSTPEAKEKGTTKRHLTQGQGKTPKNDQHTVTNETNTVSQLQVARSKTPKRQGEEGKKSKQKSRYEGK